LNTQQAKLEQISKTQAEILDALKALPCKTYPDLPSKTLR
jgi:hypothetical protein